MGLKHSSWSHLQSQPKGFLNLKANSNLQSHFVGIQPTKKDPPINGPPGFLGSRWWRRSSGPASLGLGTGNSSTAPRRLAGGRRRVVVFWCFFPPEDPRKLFFCFLFFFLLLFPGVPQLRLPLVVVPSKLQKEGDMHIRYRTAQSMSDNIHFSLRRHSADQQKRNCTRVQNHD